MQVEMSTGLLKQIRHPANLQQQSGQSAAWESDGLAMLPCVFCTFHMLANTAIVALPNQRDLNEMPHHEVGECYLVPAERMTKHDRTLANACMSTLALEANASLDAERGMQTSWKAAQSALQV